MLILNRERIVWKMKKKKKKGKKKKKKKHFIPCEPATFVQRLPNVFQTPCGIKVSRKGILVEINFGVHIPWLQMIKEF